ncbi:MAG TPA: ABC transporter permease [Catenuloplanes sp.]|jgi:putative ABC transport system permease protein
MFWVTFRGALSRKVRLALSTAAVVLGVMAVSGALITGESLDRSFTAAFLATNANLDAQVTADRLTGRVLSQADLTRVRAVPGVTGVTGEVRVDGARVVGRDGKVLTNGPAPRLGTAWSGETDQVRLRAGRGPTAPDEVAINAALASAGGFRVGDRIDVLTLQPKRTFTVAGVFGYADGRASLAGETTVAFVGQLAPVLMLGEPGGYSAANVTGTATPQELRDRIAAALGTEYQVRSRAEVVAEQSADIQDVLILFRLLLIGFAAIALFVGVFLILNTFSIIVAQRTRELALLRALGAGRGQVVRSVMAEATMVGFAAATIGLGAGYGTALILRSVLFSGLNSDAALFVPTVAVVAAYLIGPLVTVFAALLPALRSAKVAPIAAIRDATGGERSTTGLTITGLVLLTAGIGGIVAGLFGVSGDPAMPTVLGGVLGLCVGTVLLTPAMTPRATRLLGAAVAWSRPGALGRRNAARHPRRTAITAAALIVGVTLITVGSVVAASMTSTVGRLVDRELRADLLIAGDPAADGVPTFDPAVIARVAAVPGVATAVAMHGDAVQVPTGGSMFLGAGDIGGLRHIFGLRPAAGQLRPLGTGEMILSQDVADRRRLGVGDTVPVVTARGGARTLRVVAIYQKNQWFSMPLISTGDAANWFRTTQAANGYLDLAPGADATAIRSTLEGLLTDSPEVSVLDRTEFVAQKAAQIERILLALYALVGLAILVAALGIINTLALSVLERTREFGVLRAIGLSRLGTVAMVTAESTIISTFGAGVGILLGSLAGAAVVRALRPLGLEALAMPWSRLGIFLLAAVAVGLLAAIVPAIRAARLPTLRALAAE